MKALSLNLTRRSLALVVFETVLIVMAVISGVPSREWDKNPLPPDQIPLLRWIVALPAIPQPATARQSSSAASARRAINQPKKTSASR